MLKDVIDSIKAASQKLFKHWGATLIAFLLYLALIGVLYSFFTLRDATLTQVLMSLVVLPIAALILFFTLQGLGVSYVRQGVGPIYLLRRALSDSWRLFIISLPIFLLGAIVVYVIKNPDPKWMNGGVNGETLTSQIAVVVWYLMLYLALPLIVIHLWLATVRGGIKRAARGAFGGVLRAFSPRSLLIYLLVFGVFGVLVYFLFFTTAPIKNAWADLIVMGVRVAIALLMIFLGWMIALGSMAEMTAKREIGEIKI
jgi:hypothetical protein